MNIHKTIGFVAALLFVNCLYAQQYMPVNDRSSIHFTIKNFGINTGGTISGISGTIRFNPGDINAALFNVQLDAGSVDTDNNARDKHLKKEEYFDVRKHPYIHFASTAVTKESDGKYLLQGNITIKNVTKLIAIPFSVTPQQNDLLFTGSFKLNRRDFNVGGKSVILSDNLDVMLSVLAKKVN